MYVGGEIADLAAIARPAIGVVTAVQAVHLSRIGTLEAVERAKGELIEALPPDGVAVLNADDPLVTRMDRRTTARALRYGFADEADVRASGVRSNGYDGHALRPARRWRGARGRASRRSAGCPSTTPWPQPPSAWRPD